MSPSPGTLYLVATPIGNLGDITSRAVECLRRCPRIVAEDTRRTRKLLSHLSVSGACLSRLDSHADERDLRKVMGWLEAGEDVALVTDAGSPSVSDPGTDLVRAAHAQGVPVRAMPGPSAVTAAVAVSGLVDGPFYFAGFVPRQSAERAAWIADLTRRPEPCVLFEAPHRLARTLVEMSSAMPSRFAAVTRELTKVHEQVQRGTLAELAAEPADWRGEITVVLARWSLHDEARPSDADIERRIDAELQDSQSHARTVAARVAAWSGRSRREIYELVIRRKR